LRYHPRIVRRLTVLSGMLVTLAATAVALRAADGPRFGGSTELLAPPPLFSLHATLRVSP
jgi:hypothetical protein